MKIKRYTGSNTQEAMLKVKMDMGNDAIILHTRNIKQRGWLSFFSKPMVEILAAIDDEYGTKRSPDMNKNPGRMQRPGVQVKNPGVQYQNQGTQFQNNNVPEEDEYSKENNEQMNVIESKVNRLETMIRRIYEHTQGTAGNGLAKAPAAKAGEAVPKSDAVPQRPVETAAAPQRPVTAPQRPVTAPQRPAETAAAPQKLAVHNPADAEKRQEETVLKRAANPAQEPRALEPLIKNMENQEINKEIIDDISNKVKEKFAELVQKTLHGVNQQAAGLQGINLQKPNSGAGLQQTDVIRILKQEIEGIIGEPQPLKLKDDGKPTVAIFLGPTGVGKTTTIAKIAANFALNKNKKVALITSDTYRIAAVDQLKTYAEILSIPVTVVYSADEMKPAIEENSAADLILIDTAGISHKRKQQLDELKTVIEKCGADEVYLVMSATASWKNCYDVIQNHQFIDDYKLIFTKLDETPSMGLILNARYFSNKSLSYVTTGQSVPDDIDLVNVDKLAKNLLRSTAQ